MQQQHQQHEERVRSSTSSEQNREIDQETIKNIRKYENRSTEDIEKRIQRLEKEWDIERLLETNMSTLALLGIALSIFVHEYWIILPVIVLLFFLQHALQGWCPPLPVFRRLGVRYERPATPKATRTKPAIQPPYSNILRVMATPFRVYRLLDAPQSPSPGRRPHRTDRRGR